MARIYPAEFRRDAVALVRSSDKALTQVARWRRPRLVAKGDPDRDQILAALHQAIGELPEGSVVLAEDETHLNLLP